MVKQGTGAVLNVASTAAFQPLPGFATYAASKAFVVSFSEAVHSELSGTGVSVTALCPGFTRTEFTAASKTPETGDKLPDFTWMDADEVARQGVAAMVAGRRSSVPGLLNKLTSTSGRHVPRTLLLPIVKRVQRARSGD
jgi:short-subunit dehydrogenase